MTESEKMPDTLNPNALRDLYEAADALDKLWLEDFMPPGDPDEPRILAPETLAVWRKIRAALAKAIQP